MSQDYLAKHHQANIIIQSVKGNALSFPQLKSLVGPRQAARCKWLLYDQLAPFRSIEELMDLGACVILLQIESASRSPVGHFILLLDHGTHYEHFDSYGLTMDEELKITQEKHLTRIFGLGRKPIVDNSKKLQTFRQDVNTCGRWVVARLLLRQLELKEFLKLVEHFHVLYDDLVSIMTMLLQFKD